MRRGLLFTLLVSIAGSLLVSCGGRGGAEAPAPDGPPQLLILSSLIGYTEPCGCTVDLTLGGIDRAVALVDAQRAAGPTAVLVVGSTLFEGPFPAHRAAQEHAKAGLLAKALQRMGVAAYAPGPGDLAGGADALKTLRATFTAPDVLAGSQLLTLGALKVGVLGLAHAAEDAPVDGAPVQAEAERLRREGAQVVVALANRPRRAIRRLARAVDAVDLWVLGDHPKEETAASPAGAGYLIEAGDRGRHLGRIRLLDAAAPGRLADPEGDRARAKRALESQLKMKTRMLAITRDQSLEAGVTALKAQLAALPPPAATGKRFEYQLLPIEEAAPRDPEVRRWVSDYNAQLKQLNLSAAGEVPPVPEGGQRYVGVAECEDCHPDAVAHWRTTPHARAWATLQAADKTFDAECVGCHVVGWQQPGGTVLGKTEGLQDVQCEACHGPNERHVEMGGGEAYTVRDPAEAVCTPCHHPHHSPKFDFATYRAQIIGPGHGQPIYVDAPAAPATP